MSTFEFISVLLFLQAVLITPTDLEKAPDLEAHFFSVRPWFFSLGVLVTVAELGDTATVSETLNELLARIARAKRPETREKRLSQMLDELREGDRYMNMPYRARR